MVFLILNLDVFDEQRIIISVYVSQSMSSYCPLLYAIVYVSSFPSIRRSLSPSPGDPNGEIVYLRIAWYRSSKWLFVNCMSYTSLSWHRVVYEYRVVEIVFWVGDAMG